MRLAPLRRLGASVIALGLLIAACGGAGGEAEDRATATTRGIILGSFDFSESATVGEVYAQALEAVGFEVQRATGLGSREVVEPALEQGALDVVPEYLGSVLQFLHAGTLSGSALTDTGTAYPLLRETFEARGVTALAPAPGQNQNAVAVTRRTAERLGLSRISDLAPVAGGLVFGGPPECPERPFCLLGLRSTYGLAFKEFRPLDDASGPATIAALEGEEVDAALVFTTSPATERFVVLEDDRSLQPAENLVPVVRTDTLRRHGERLVRVLDAVSANLHTEDLVVLNRQVDVDGRPTAEVARAWLAQHGLGRP